MVARRVAAVVWAAASMVARVEEKRVEAVCEAVGIKVARVVVRMVGVGEGAETMAETDLRRRQRWCTLMHRHSGTVQLRTPLDNFLRSLRGR